MHKHWRATSSPAPRAETGEHAKSRPAQIGAETCIGQGRSLAVVLGTADFESVLLTNKQRVALALAQEYETIYINSLGLRRPRVNRADLKRIATSALRRIRPTAKERTGQHESGLPRVVEPAVLPYHDSKLIRFLNRYFLQRQVRRILRGASRSVLWTFSPLSYDLWHLFDSTVYHSVDLIHEASNMPHELVHDEATVGSAATLVIASSEVIRNDLEKRLSRSDILLWENVADDAFMKVDLTGSRTELAVFAGNLTPEKVDFELLGEIANTGMSLLLVGPHAIDGSDRPEELVALVSRPNVTLMGALPPAELAEVISHATVGLIPYRLTPHTAGIFPLKLYEYLAAGLAVVSTRLPSIVGTRSDHVVLSAPDQYIDAVRRCIAVPTVDVCHDRRSLAAARTWEQRGREVRELARELLSS